MGWETRGQHTYYYKKQRISGTVKSVYIGCGEEAKVIARVDEILRLAAKLRAENRKKPKQQKS